ncbi:unnamed protein product [Orchesella dallaii]|uniref:Uncharacterized protein n=1 Tax=Orchesella dallaii TaxID=48710 RepID=A0ABP1PSU0_9HEXA
MGALMSVVAWAVPLTFFTFSKTKRSNKIGDGDGETSFPPIYGQMYPPPSVTSDYKTKYKSEENAHPPKSYKLATLYGRTAYFPVDPYFKELNPKSMRTRCPRYDLEVVFKETRQSLLNNDKRWFSQKAGFTDKKEAEAEPSTSERYGYDKSANENDNPFRFDREYQDFMMQTKLHESCIPDLDTYH